MGVEPTISTRYERGMIFRFTHPQLNFKELIKIVLGVFIEYFVHPTKQSIPGIIPATKKFFKRPSYSRSVVSYPLHQVVFLSYTTKHQMVEPQRIEL